MVKNGKHFAQCNEQFNLYLSCLPDNILKNPTHLEPSTKSNSVKNIVDYFSSLGVSHSDIFRGIQKFRDVPINYEYISDPDSWVNILELYTIITNCHYYCMTKCGIEDWLTIASNVYDHHQHKMWKVMTQLIPMNIMFEKVTSLISNYNNYQNLNKVPSMNKNEVIYEVKLNKELIDISPGVAVHYTAGVLAQIPRAHGFQQADVEIIFSQMKLLNIINILYKKYSLCYLQRQNSILINDEIVGNFVEFNEEANCKEDLFKSTAKMATGILITTDYRHNNVLLLRKGDIYNGPVSKIKLNWHGGKSLINKMGLYLKTPKKISELISYHAQQINETKRRYIESEMSRLRAENAIVLANSAKQELDRYVDKLEKIVESRTADIKRQNEFMSLFSSSISHALKTPLTSLLGSMEILVNYAGEIDRMDALHFYDNMSNDVKRLEKLVGQLLQLSKAELGIKRKCYAYTVLNKLVELYEAKGLEVTIKMKNDIELPISKDSLTAIFDNLLENTLCHAGKDAKVYISMVNKKPDKIAIMYYDSGQGISMEAEKHIFNPLFTTAKNSTQTGMGLSIVKRLMENSGCFVRQISCKRGAKFKLVFIWKENL